MIQIIITLYQKKKSLVLITSNTENALNQKLNNKNLSVL